MKTKVGKGVATVLEQDRNGCERASRRAQPVKGLVGPTWWQEKADARRLSSDLHLCDIAHANSQ